MYNDITRIIKGLEIIQKYKPNANIYAKNNQTWFLEAQEEEFLQIVKEDREKLIKYGWRQRKASPYQWILPTSHGLNLEKKIPDLFQ